jgi:hypothetical protein
VTPPRKGAFAGIGTVSPPAPKPEAPGALREHELKTWPAYYDAVARGDKPFEIRRDDRGYRVGDTLHLRRWTPADGYSGESMRVSVTYVTDGGQLGCLTPGHVVLGITVLATADATDEEGWWTTDMEDEPCGGCGVKPSRHAGHGSYVCRTCHEARWCKQCHFQVHEGKCAEPKTHANADGAPLQVWIEKREGYLGWTGEWDLGRDPKDDDEDRGAVGPYVLAIQTATDEERAKLWLWCRVYTKGDVDSLAREFATIRAETEARVRAERDAEAEARGRAERDELRTELGDRLAWKNAVYGKTSQ